MGRPAQKGFRTIEEFSRSYIKNALIFLGCNNGAPLSRDMWEARIRRGVSEEMRLSEEQVILLHHSFHWASFLDSSKINSPFELISAQEIDAEGKTCLINYVFMKGGDLNLSAFLDYINSEYGSYIKERVSRFNIPLQ